MSDRTIIVCDIDGTIADLTHRLHHIQGERKDWDAFFDACVDDAPHDDVIDLVWTAVRAPGAEVIYVSGRSDRVRTQTRAWLDKHKLPGGLLLMRCHGDHRPDDIVKAEIVDKNTDLLRPDRVWFVLDDRDRVVQMWRRRGFRVLQVADGAF